MPKMARIMGPLTLASFLYWTPAHASTYNVNFTINSTNITGSIVTDGHIGPLALFDVTSWSFTYSGGALSGTGFANPATADDAVAPVPLIASASAITVDPSATGYFDFQSTMTPWFTLQFNSVGNGIMEVFASDNTPGPVGNHITQDVSNSFTIATIATPLPAALPLFATGLGALGLLGWHRKKKAIAA